MGRGEAEGVRGKGLRVRGHIEYVRRSIQS